MAVGRILIIPTIGLLNSNRPAFTLKRMINADGINNWIDKKNNAFVENQDVVEAEVISKEDA